MHDVQSWAIIRLSETFECIASIFKAFGSSFSQSIFSTCIRRKKINFLKINLISSTEREIDNETKILALYMVNGQDIIHFPNVNDQS